MDRNLLDSIIARIKRVNGLLVYQGFGYQTSLGHVIDQLCHVGKHQAAKYIFEAVWKIQ